MLWAYREIVEGRSISAAQLASEARNHSGGAVQPHAPWSIILGRNNYSALDLGRLLSYFRTDTETAELIGDGDWEALEGVGEEWSKGLGVS